LFLTVNRFARSTPWLHGPAEAYAVYGIVVFAALIVLGWWLARDKGSITMAYALLTPVAAVVALLVQQVIVRLVDEARPYALHPDALVLVSRTSDPSFPSDHACVVGAVAAGLFFVDRRLGWVTTALAGLMAVTRVYVGAHWPLDVVVGLVVGAAVAAAVLVLLRRPVARLVDAAASTRLRPLVEAH
jgi:undecaprenyl-diphosphatase